MPSTRVAYLLASLVMCFISEMPSAVLASDNQPIDPDDKPLPMGAIARLGSLRLRHDRPVRAIAYSPDGKKIASVTEFDTTIRVWDIASGRLLHEFDAPQLFTHGHVPPADYHKFAFTPDGKSIAGGVGADVCFWELQSGREVRRYRGTGNLMLALTFAHDGKTFFCGGSDHTFRQWDITTGKELHRWDYFKGRRPQSDEDGLPQERAYFKAISRDGKTAVWHCEYWTHQGNGLLRDRCWLTVWDVAAGTDRCLIVDDDGVAIRAEHIALSADGKHLTAFAANSEMIVWDTATGKKLKSLGKGGVIEAVAYSPDGRRVAAVVRSGSRWLNVWDLTSGDELWSRPISWFGGIGPNRSLVFAPDGKTLATAHGKNVRIWDVESAQEIPPIDGHRWPVRTLAFSRKDGVLISADSASACEWNMTPRQTQRHSLIEHHGASRSMAESYEANLRIHFEVRPQLRELFTNKLLGEFADQKGDFGFGRISANGSTVALVGDDRKNVAFFDVPSRKVRSKLAPDDPIGRELVLSADGKWAALPCPDQTVALIGTSNGLIIRWLGNPQVVAKPGEGICMSNGVFSPDGQLLAFGTYDQLAGKLDDSLPDAPGIRIWDVPSGRELRQFDDSLSTALHGQVVALRFSPDSRNLAIALRFRADTVGDLEASVAPILEVASGRFRRRFKGHTDEVASLAFYPDGLRLATGSEDTTILLWDMKCLMAAEPGAGKTTTERLTLLWSDLAEHDAARAFDAILALAAMRDQCLPFLAQRLKPADLPSDELLNKLIAELDSDSFRTRNAASAKLADLRELARPALKKALNSQLSPEAYRRIGEILVQLDSTKYSLNLLRDIRSVEVLERIASPQARQFLETLAAGVDEAILTMEARAALTRLKPAR